MCGALLLATVAQMHLIPWCCPMMSCCGAGVNTTRTARVMAARGAEQLYADNNFESHSPGGQLTMLTPRGQHHHPHEDDGY